MKIEIGSSSFARKEINKARFGKVISNMLDTLGIPVGFTVTKTENPDFITINDHPCFFPHSLVKNVDDYIIFLEKKGKGSNEDLYWELIINHILWLQPGMLLTDDLLPFYMPALNLVPGDNFREIQTHCKEIIIELLNLKISLTNKDVISKISEKYLNNQKFDWNEFREELIGSLLSPEISIFFNEDYFARIISSKSKENLFEMMRDGLFYETGIRYPSFKILFDINLPGSAFFYKINSFTSIPVDGLAEQDDILVNETPDRLKLLGIDGRENLNPANGNKASIINRLDRKAVEEAGLTTWDSLGYFILSLSSFLRTYGYTCIDKKMILEYLETLKLIYPKIIELTEKENLLPVFVKTLRILAKEEISIRNFRTILEGILSSDYIIADAQEYIIFDERIPVKYNMENGWKDKAENIVEFVRIRLKKFISHKYTRGQNTLIVYLLDPEIEKVVDHSINSLNTLDTKTYKKIIAAVNDEIGNLTASSLPPVILTTVNVRSHIKKIIELCYPQVAVLSYQELSPELNIQPIARISFN